MSTHQIISKVWSFRNTLRNDGMGTGCDLSVQMIATGPYNNHLLL